MQSAYTGVRTIPRFPSERQKAEVSLQVTKDAGFSAEAEITNGGLLSIAILVSSIVLSTAVLIHVDTPFQPFEKLLLAIHP